MKKMSLIVPVMLCCGILCATPYGRALKQARKVADQKHRYEAPSKRGPQRQAPAPKDEFVRIWQQMDRVIKQNKGHLPGPAGVAGLRKLCGPGKVSPALLKINDFKKMSEKNCAWAYMGGALGALHALPRGGEFPILFSKPRPGIRQIKILLSNGRVKVLDSRRIVSCAGVINTLRRSSPHAKHPAWKKLSIAAGQIDRARR